MRKLLAALIACGMLAAHVPAFAAQGKDDEKKSEKAKGDEKKAEKSQEEEKKKSTKRRKGGCG